MSRNPGGGTTAAFLQHSHITFAKGFQVMITSGLSNSHQVCISSSSSQENEGKRRGDLFMDSQEMNKKGGISKPTVLALSFLSHYKACVVEAGIFFILHFSRLKLPIFSLAGNMTCFQSFDGTRERPKC